MAFRAGPQCRSAMPVCNMAAFQQVVQPLAEKPDIGKFGGEPFEALPLRSKGKA